jgi:hypothetical protein
MKTMVGKRRFRELTTDRPLAIWFITALVLSVAFGFVGRLSYEAGLALALLLGCVPALLWRRMATNSFCCNEDADEAMAEFLAKGRRIERDLGARQSRDEP